MRARARLRLVVLGGLCVFGSACTLLGFGVTDDVTDEDLECYEQIRTLEADNERLTDELERARRELRAVEQEEYPRFVGAFELYVSKDWAGAVDAFASFLRDFPDSPLEAVAQKLLTVCRVNDAESKLLCRESWRLMQDELEPLTPPERLARVGTFVRQCPDYEARVESKLQQLERQDAIKRRYTGEGERDRARGDDVDLGVEPPPVQAEDLFDVDRVERPDLDEVTAPGQ